MTHSTITDRIIEACRDGADMATIHATVGGSKASLLARIPQLVTQGRLHKAGTPMLQRYFADAEMAATWRPTQKEPQRPRRDAEADRQVALSLLNENGITANAIVQALGATWKSADRLLRRLVAAGDLHPRGGNRRTTYFRTAAEAQAWVAPAVPKEQRPRAKASALPASVTLGRRGFAANAQIVIPPGLVIQHGPGVLHDTRYYVPPNERVIGGFVSEWRNLCGDAVERKS